MKCIYAFGHIRILVAGLRWSPIDKSNAWHTAPPDVRNKPRAPLPNPRSSERDLRVKEGHSLTVARWRRIASPQRKRPPETGWGRWGRGGGASPRVAAPPSPSRRLSCPRLSLAQAWFFPPCQIHSHLLSLSPSTGPCYKEESRREMGCKSCKHMGQAP